MQSRLYRALITLAVAGLVLVPVLMGCDSEGELAVVNTQETVDTARTYVLEPVFSAARSTLDAKFQEYQMTGGSPSAWNYRDDNLTFSGYRTTIIGACGANAAQVHITQTPDGMDPNKFTDKARFAQTYTICN